MKRNKEAAEPRDEIIADLHRTREALALQFKGDLAALTADAQKRQLASGRKIIVRSARSVKTGKAKT